MSFTRAYTQCVYMPDPDAEPVGYVNPVGRGAGIPVLRLHQDVGSFTVQFDSGNLAAAIRYLRQLADAAAVLADRVQAEVDAKAAAK